MSITVAISTRDRADALARCLASLAQGEHAPDEIVVVDQSSSDETRAVVAAHDVEYVRDRGTGLGRAQNLAFGRASGDVVAVLDDDCVADRGWVAAVERAFASGYDVVTGPVLPLPSEDASLVPVSSRLREEPLELRAGTLPWDVGSGNNFAVRRDLFLSIGGCDERLGPGSAGLGGVDMDLFHRLLRAGARGRYEPSAVVFHEQKPLSERRARRYPYGHGMAAATVIWLRGGDPTALRVLRGWLALRSRLLASALKHRRGAAAAEELLVLGGTARGLLHGWRVGRREAARS